MTNVEKSNLSQDFRLLHVVELDRVNGGVTGNDGGCVPYINLLERHDPGVAYPSWVIAQILGKH
jgi:hypothetical protein